MQAQERDRITINGTSATQVYEFKFADPDNGVERKVSFEASNLDDARATIIGLAIVVSQEFAKANPL